MPRRDGPYPKAHRLDKQASLSITTNLRLRLRQIKIPLPYMTILPTALGVATQQLNALESVYIHYQSHQSLHRASYIKNI